MTRLLAAACLAVALAVPAQAAEKLTFVMSWRAQAENGGFYQAVAKGFYDACGIDMTLRMGGAGIDPTQLLVGGAVDVALVGQNDGVMRMNQAGFASRAVMATFQRVAATLDAHPDAGINGFADMKGHPILVSAANRNTWWPFLKLKYGFADDQLRSFTGQFAQFLSDKTVVQQDLITNGPFLMKRDANFDVRAFLLADAGYNPYSSLIVVPQPMINQKPGVVQCLVDASRRGWIDYLRDPSVGFAEIRKVAPENTPDLLQYAFDTLKKYNIIESEESARLGVGSMTDARWKDHFDNLLSLKLFPPTFDYRSSYTLQFLGKTPS